MSQPPKSPVSEVIRNTESLIFRVIDLRRRVGELEAQAARLLEDAYADAVNALGEADGGVAYHLACRGLGVDPAMRSGASPALTPPATPAPAAVPAAPPATPPAPASLPASPAPEAPEVPVPDFPADTMPAPAARVQPAASAPRVHPLADAPSPAPAASVRETDPTRLVLYGVAIKRSKLAEAEEVVDQARRTAAQNHKHNPYADDRGRNAWRNNLFAAVLASEGGEAQPDRPHRPDPVDIAPAGPDASVPASNQAELPALPTVPYRPSGEDSDGTVDARTGSSSGGTTRDEDVLDDAPTRSPPVPSRAVPFTRNPVQVETALPADEGAPPALRRSPSFVPAPAPEPEVHVDRPVHNRIVAHGQAVPMPKSLKEALGRRVEEAPAADPAPAPKGPPFRRAPSFVPR